MEENNLQTVPQATETPQVSPVKNNGFLVTLLSILLLISVFIAGFFAYQTQRLVVELENISVTPTPTAKDDQKTGLLNYVDSVYKYSIGYPQGWTVTPTPAEGFGGVASFTNNLNKFEVGKHISEIEDKQTLVEYFNKNQSEPVETIEQKNITLGNMEVLRIVLPIIHGDSGWKYGIYYTFIKESNVYFLEFYSNDYTKDISLSDSIVSTFKFTSLEQTACTMEAKVCPDGSSVGRSGPKCEFMACPTIKPTATTSPQP